MGEIEKEKTKQAHTQPFSAGQSKQDKAEGFLPRAEMELKGRCPGGEAPGGTRAPVSKPSPPRPLLSQPSSRSQGRGQAEEMGLLSV